MTTAAPEAIRCQDGCGRTVKDMSEAEAKAWTFLTISKRWRCPECRRALDTVNTESKKMTAYAPACPACRDDLKTYYIHCQGCQARRARDMITYHKKPSQPLPNPSTPQS